MISGVNLMQYGYAFRVAKRLRPPPKEVRFAKASWVSHIRLAPGSVRALGNRSQYQPRLSNFRHRYSKEKYHSYLILAHPLFLKNTFLEENENMPSCISLCFRLIFLAALLLRLGGNAHAEVASVYGGRDGLCGHRTANGERLNCSAMTARIAHCRSARAFVCATKDAWLYGSTIVVPGFAADTLICHQQRHERSDYTRPDTSL